MRPDRVLRSRRKTLAIEVRPDGQVWVRAPLRLPHEVIERFLNEKSAWVQQKQAQVRQRQQAAAEAHAETPTQAFYLGQSYSIVASPAARHVSLRASHLLVPPDQVAEPTAALASFYRREAHRQLPEMVRVYAEAHQFHYSKIRISSAHTRWGSCSHRGVVSLSWRLMMLPPELIEYVILHELTHLVVPNHSPRFWQTMQALLSDTPLRRQQLRAWEKRLTL